MAIQLKISHPLKNIKVLKIAIKINSKGLMVAASPQFSLGDELILNFEQGLKLSGKIFKFSQNPQGQKGMIIQFIELSAQNKKDIQELLAQEKKLASSDHKSMTQNSEEQETQAMLGEKTIITDLNSLDHLALQSPDQNPNFVASTFDEENFKSSSSNDLAQKTRIEMHLPKIAQDRKKTRRKKYLGIIAILLAATTLKLGVDKKFKQLWEKSKSLQDKIPEVISVQDVKKKQNTAPKKNIPNKPRQKRRSSKTQAPTSSKNSTSARRLTQLNYIKTAAFYKISISATEKLNNPNVVRLSNPSRIRIDFVNTQKGKTRSLIKVSDNVINTIDTQQVNTTTRIVINLNQSRYPRYDIKTYDRFADIFIYTVN
ncbi:MAG TPA: AMIN domain-containing protein [Oligoflexia bacterium]|nr:AMIN domain-containing protein [Oligoflexia bacterium]HMR25325.1 AMIN domain-containing protein [Oligoflexia bacterium]